MSCYIIFFPFDNNNYYYYYYSYQYYYYYYYSAKLLSSERIKRLSRLWNAERTSTVPWWNDDKTVLRRLCLFSCVFSFKDSPGVHFDGFLNESEFLIVRHFGQILGVGVSNIVFFFFQIGYFNLFVFIFLLISFS